MNQNYEPTIDPDLQNRIEETEKPHQNEEILRWLRDETNRNLSRMADVLDVERSTVNEWLHRTDIKGENFDPDAVDWSNLDVDRLIEVLFRPHQDPRVLYELHVRRELPTTEMAEILYAAESTIRHQMAVNGVPIRDPLENQPDTELFINDGRQQLREEGGSAYLSRLAGYAEHGDEIYDCHAHHDLGVGFGDAPRFITPLTPGDHVRLHEHGDYEYVDGFPVLRPEESNDDRDDTDPDPDGSVSIEDGPAEDPAAPVTADAVTRGCR